MQAAGPGKARLVGGVQQVARALQQAAGVLLGQELQEALGADAHPASEQALEVELAQANPASQFVQVRLAAGVLFDILDGTGDTGVISEN